MMVVAWNPADKSANITLSGSNLVATTTSSAQGAVRADTSFASGKLYFEARFNPSAGGSDTGIGWANSTGSLNSFIGIDKNGVAVFPTNGSAGETFFNNASIGNGGGPAGITAVVCIAFDITSKLWWVRLGGLGWNGGAGDPGAGTGGYSVSTINAGPYFPAFCANQSGQSVTANFGGLPFLFPIPSGFSPPDTSGAGYTNYEASTKFEAPGVIAPAQTGLASTKFEGLPVLGPFQGGMGSTKFEAPGVIGPDQRGMASTKFLCYAILAPLVPEFSQGYIFG